MCDPLVNEYERLAARRRREYADALDKSWYKCGFYDLLGYDRHGRSYRTVEDDAPIIVAATGQVDGVGEVMFLSEV